MNQTHFVSARIDKNVLSLPFMTVMPFNRTTVVLVGIPTHQSCNINPPLSGLTRNFPNCLSARMDGTLPEPHSSQLPLLWNQVVKKLASNARHSALFA